MFGKIKFVEIDQPRGSVRTSLVAGLFVCGKFLLAGTPGYRVVVNAAASRQPLQGVWEVSVLSGYAQTKQLFFVKVLLGFRTKYENFFHFKKRTRKAGHSERIPGFFICSCRSVKLYIRVDPRMVGAVDLLIEHSRTEIKHFGAGARGGDVVAGTCRRYGICPTVP